MGQTQLMGFKLSEQKQLFDNFELAEPNIERADDVMGLVADPTSTSASKFLISSGIEANGNKTREFRELTMDDVSLTGSNFDFYTSEKVYNTVLEDYDTAGISAKDIVDQETAAADPNITDADTISTALRKLENKVLTGGGAISTKLYEDGVSADAVGGIYESRYAVKSDNNNDVFVSSYSIFSLPTPESIPGGFSVTFKAENGPVYIYPSYTVAHVSDPPKVEGEYPYFILTEKDAFAR